MPIVLHSREDWMSYSTKLVLPRLIIWCVGLTLMFLCDGVEAGEPNDYVGSPAVLHQSASPLSPSAVTSDWPRLLGPTNNNISPETKLLKKWPAGGPQLVWEMPVGEGYAAPVIKGDRLVYFHRIGDEAVIECLHAETGQRIWQRRYATTYKDRYGLNNGPRTPPVIDGETIFTYGADGQLRCNDLVGGQLIWERNTSSDFHVPQDYFGVGSSPLVDGDLLIVNVGAPKGPCVVAFNKRTGQVVWKSGETWGPSYAAPVIATLHGQDRVLVFAGGDSRPPTGGLLSIDPTSGAIDFRFPFRSKRYESVNASSPVVIGSEVFLSSSYHTGGVLLKLTGAGDYKVAWKTDGLRCHFMTPIHKDGYLYGVDGMSRSELALTCIDLKSGKQLWRKQPDWTETIGSGKKKREVSFSIGHGSLIWADGAFLAFGDEGHLAWLDLTPGGYKEIVRTRLFAARRSYTPPVLSRGLLYVVQIERGLLDGTKPRMLCFDLRAQ